MFDKLLGLVIKATNLTPKYTADRCLHVKRTVGGCSLCRDVCPHEAITIKRFVEIDEIDCTGCGLCVQACPSEALGARVRVQPGVPLRCSQVSGTASSVQCLTRLRATDVLRLAGRQDSVTLARGDCANCKIGGAAVPAALETLVAEAKALAEFRGKPLDITLTETDTLELTDNPNVVSRRDLFRGSWRELQRGTADVLEPFDPGDDDERPLPVELQKRYYLIELAKPAPEDKVPWTLPHVDDGCIMCPVCTNVCPTGAFRRDFDDEGSGATLMLEPSRCLGCNACTDSCPVNVIGLDTPVPWSRLAADELVMHRKEDKGSAGTVSRR